MASKKKTSSRKKTTGKQYKSTAKNKQTAPSFSWKSEVLLFVVLAFSVILFLTNIGKGGSIGNVISTFFFGLFGLMAYAFPFVLFFMVAFLISNKVSTNRKKSTYSGRVLAKFFACIVFFVFLCVFFHLVFFGSESNTWLYIYASCAKEKTGGGVFGSVIAVALIHAFGLAAAYVIDIILLVLCVVLITEKSLFAGLSKGSQKMYSTAKMDAIKRQEKSAIRKEERRARKEAEKEEAAKKEAEQKESEQKEAGMRLTNKVYGVSTDTALHRQEPAAMSQTGDIHEIHPDIFVPYEEESWSALENAAASSHTDAFASTSLEGEAEDNDAAPEKKRRVRKTKASAAMTAAQAEEIQQTVQEAPAVADDYKFPSISLLKKGDPTQTGDSRQHLQQMSMRLQQTLETFGVNAKVTNVVCGPAVTQYEIQPEMGVKVSKIVNLSDDLKLNLMVSDIRIEAPIPGKAAIGIEVPNKENVTVAFRDLVESAEFQKHSSKISFCAGKDIAGNVIVADIAKMPHLLIAGATGSGKSVCINTIIMSILYKARPDEVKLIMIDPKVVELSVYNNIPHLLCPVVTDPKKAAGALHWAVAEMTDRYNKFAEYGVRDMKGYNQKVASIAEIEDDNKPQKMPQIVVIVDELADLMMVAPGDVEDSICRLAQLARAAGIHLIIATQRPSVNVITGLIKANMPSRIAFSVTSGVDSRTILDMNGAEKLLGKGDMLYYPQGLSKPLRVQGAFVSDEEVSAVTNDIIKNNVQVTYNNSIEETVIENSSALGGSLVMSVGDDGKDSYFFDAARFIIEKEKGSIGLLQRNFKIGFNRAARIMDQLEEAGVVGPEEGTKPRRVLLTLEQFENIKDTF